MQSAERPHDPGLFLDRLAALASAPGWRGKVFGHQAGCPIHVLRRSGASAAARRLYISAGIHGDEPAGPLALLEMVASGFDFGGLATTLCPALAPDNLRAGVRTNRNGIDLNRDYRNPVTAEIAAHTAEIGPEPVFDACLCLHEDWEAEGAYLYEVPVHTEPGWAEALRDAMARVIPADPRPKIDGRAAVAGIIRPPEPIEARPQWPESLWLASLGHRRLFTVETPSALPLARRVAAQQAAVRALCALLARLKPES